MRCWRRQGRRILRGASHPGGCCPIVVRSPIRIRDEGRTGQARARGRRGGRRRSEYVPAPTHLRGSSLIRKFRMARNPTTHRGSYTPRTNGKARTLDNGMPTYHESTMYGTKSIAPTYSALFRFELLYAAYLNIDLNTYLVSRAHTPRRVLSQNCLARPPAAPPRPRDPAAPRHAPGAHVRRCVPSPHVRTVARS